MESTRFPGKPLALILGKPMIVWVCESASIAVGQDNVFVATNSEQIGKVVENFGFGVIYTSSSCRTGTDRVAEAMRMLGLDKALNVQGDEPMIEPELISLVTNKLESTSCVLNLAARLGPLEKPEDPSIPKLVVSQTGRLMYASRSAIPGSKEENVKQKRSLLKQVCVYGFNLANLAPFGPEGVKTPLEDIEDIELLRFIENDVTVEILITESRSIAVDHPHDIGRVELALTSAEASHT